MAVGCSLELKNAPAIPHPTQLSNPVIGTIFQTSAVTLLSRYSVRLLLLFYSGCRYVYFLSNQLPSRLLKCGYCWTSFLCIQYQNIGHACMKYRIHVKYCEIFARHTEICIYVKYNYDSDTPSNMYIFFIISECHLIRQKQIM